MNKTLSYILIIIVSGLIGFMVGSSKPSIQLLGIAIPFIIGLYYRQQIHELYLKTKADKVISLLFIAFFGGWLVIIKNLPTTEWQLNLLWAAWVIICVILLGKLSLLITNYEFALVMKNHDLKEAWEVIEPQLKEFFRWRKVGEKEPRPPNKKEKQALSKYKDIVAITYKEIPPRATICHILFKYRPSSDAVRDAYGIAIRTKTDKDNPEFAEALALKRAIKSYLKLKKQAGKNVSK